MATKRGPSFRRTPPGPVSTQSEPPPPPPPLRPAQGLLLVGRERARLDQLVAQLEEPLELRVVLGETPLGVVPRRLGGDEELPVRGLQDERLPAGLREDAPVERRAVAGRPAEMLDERLLGVVN